MSRWANPLVKSLMTIIKFTRLHSKETVKFIGQDHCGNKYFESDRPNNLYRRASRFFQAPKVESFDDVVQSANVPPAWDAWLRFRRKEPPTKEEVEEGEEYFRYQQQLAAQKKEASDAQTQSSPNTTKVAVEETTLRNHYDK